MELVLKDVSKKLKGQFVLKNINATFNSGKIYGIIGRNGSGKTMLFRAMSGLMRVQGEVWIDGELLGRDRNVLPDLGMIIENTEMYAEFSGYTNLMLLANVNKKIDRQRIVQVMEQMGLDARSKKIVKKYSLGMRQKLAIAQAIMEEPRILLLDEPTNGLDDEAVGMLRRILLQEKEKGTMVFLASHSKEDIALLADEVYRMSNGVLTKESGENAAEVERY